MEIAYVHPDELRRWQRAATQKDRTRRAIRERLLAGEPAKEIATDYDLPIAFITFLGEWQLCGDDPQPNLVCHASSGEPI